MKRYLVIALCVVTVAKLAQIGIHWQKTAVLMWAVKADHPSVVSYALAMGTDTNIEDARWRTPIYYAKSAEVTEMLLTDAAYGAEFCCADSAGMTPLHVVRNVDVAQVLVQHGASLDARDNSGRTPARAALTRGDLDVYAAYQRPDSTSALSQIDRVPQYVTDPRSHGISNDRPVP